jgi:hypothetical protein
MLQPEAYTLIDKPRSNTLHHVVGETTSGVLQLQKYHHLVDIDTISYRNPYHLGTGTVVIVHPYTYDVYLHVSSSRDPEAGVLSAARLSDPVKYLVNCMS